MDRTHRKSFGKTAATLRALADLAELAGARCLPIRFLVLWILRPAETVACNYAIQLGIPAWQLAAPGGSTPDDALNLAYNLRALADAFEALGDMLARPSVLLSPHLTRLGTRIAPVLRGRPPLFDTS